MSNDDKADPADTVAAVSPSADTSARGILNCLLMLIDEAAALALPGTLTALCSALDVCRAESTAPPAQAALWCAPPPSTAIH